MVDPDFLIMFCHVIKFDMGVREGKKLARDAFTKIGPRKASLLTHQHQYVVCTGEDKIAIGFLVRLASFVGPPL